MKTQWKRMCRIIGYRVLPLTNNVPNELKIVLVLTNSHTDEYVRLLDACADALSMRKCIAGTHPICTRYIHEYEKRLQSLFGDRFFICFFCLKEVEFTPMIYFWEESFFTLITMD